MELKFLHDSGIAQHLQGKVIDYVSGEREGFTITGEDAGNACGDCSC